MAQQHSIRMLVCYFGEWPAWFTYFLESCKYNPSVDFYLFSDCVPTGREPGNVKIIAFSLADFNALASRKLGFAIQVERLRKLCDFKPAYGLIFEEYLHGIDFWGQCDIDLVFGNIRKFVNRLLPNYDVITARKEYVVGHFTLYRNAAAVNTLFKRSKDYRQVFESADHYCFDECNFLWWYLLAGVPVHYITPDIDSMTHVVKRMHKAKVVKAFFRTMMIEQDKLDDNGNPAEFREQLLWKQGRLTSLATGKGYLYFHFHFLKRHETFVIPACDSVPGHFRVSQYGFELPAVPNAPAVLPHPAGNRG